MAKINKVGNIVNGVMIDSDEDLIITTQKGQLLRLNVNDIKSTSRTALGLRYINIKDPNDQVVGITTAKIEEGCDNNNDNK